MWLLGAINMILHRRQCDIFARGQRHVILHCLQCNSFRRKKCSEGVAKALPGLGLCQEYKVRSKSEFSHPYRSTLG